MLTKCANCSKVIDRQKHRVLKGNCYCNACCQMKYEYKQGIRNKKTIASAAHEAVRKKSQKRFNKNPNTKIGKRGYKLIYIPLKGWKKYHHYVWGKNYGLIPKGMVIHHINLDKLDNRIENLQMMPNNEHAKLHGRLRKRNKKGQYKIKEKKRNE